MKTIKTLICEVRADGDHHRDDSLRDGTTYRILYGDDLIIESTVSPVFATAEALSSRGFAPDTRFARRDWHGDAVRCVTPIEEAMI